MHGYASVVTERDDQGFLGDRKERGSSMRGAESRFRPPIGGN